MQRDALVTYLDEYLKLKAFAHDDSLNGLQVSGAEEVTRVALAVDARLSAFEAAAEWGAQLLIVHHGLFWGQAYALTGPNYARFRVLFTHNLGVYGVHLPLDAHPVVGNNAELVRLLGLSEPHPFGTYHDYTIGMAGTLPEPTPLVEVASRLGAALGEMPIRLIDAGRPVQRVACISGGAAMMAWQALEGGYDTYVTGELSHSHLPMLEEMGINVIFAGHYLTETLGVKALGRHVAAQFGLETRFFDFPTGA